MPRNLFKPTTFTTLSTGTRTEEDSWEHLKRKQARQISREELHQMERKKTVFVALVHRTVKKFKIPMHHLTRDFLDKHLHKFEGLPGIFDTINHIPASFVREFEVAAQNQSHLVQTHPEVLKKDGPRAREAKNKRATSKARYEAMQKRNQPKTQDRRQVAEPSSTTPQETHQEVKLSTPEPAATRVKSSWATHEERKARWKASQKKSPNSR